MPPRPPAKKAAEKASHKDSAMPGSVQLRPPALLSANSGSWTANYLRHARLVQRMGIDWDAPAATPTDAPPTQTTSEVVTPLPVESDTSNQVAAEEFETAEDHVLAMTERQPQLSAAVRSLAPHYTYDEILSAMEATNLAARTSTKCGPVVSNMNPSSSEAAAKEAMPKTPTPSSPADSSNELPVGDGSPVTKVSRHSAPAVVTQDTLPFTLEAPEPSAAVVPSTQQRSAEPKLGQNGSMSHWLDLCFVVDADGYVDYLDIAICAREFLNSFGFRICYVDEQQLVYIVLDNYDATEPGVVQIEEQTFRVVRGVRWSEAGLALQARPMRPRAEPEGGFGCLPGLDPVIISAHPATRQLVKVPGLLVAGTLHQLDIAATLKQWLGQTFIADLDCAVEQKSAYVAYRAAFECVRDLTPLLGTEQFKRFLINSFPDILPIQLGAKSSLKKVYHGLRWGPSAEEQATVPGSPDTPVTCCNISEGHPTQLDLDGIVSAWLRDVLTADPDCFLDPVDVTLAYASRFLPAPDTVGIGPGCMIRLVQSVFGADVSLYPPDRENSAIIGLQNSAIVGLRWTALEGNRCSFATSFQPFPEPLRHDAHKLLHLPQPKRTFAWLYMYLVRESQSAVSAGALFDMYERAFRRSRDTHPTLPEAEFQARVKRAFKGCRVMEVSHNHFAFQGVALAFPSRTPEQQLSIINEHTLEKHVAAGRIELPSRPSEFAMHLARDPLFLSQPTRVINAGEASKLGYKVPNHLDHATDKVTTLTTGSFIDRLERRARRGVPGRAPFGDEEPGFPGVSMQHEQMRVKEVYRDVVDRGVKGHDVLDGRVVPQPWHETADTLLAALPDYCRPQPRKTGASPKQA